MNQLLIAIQNGSNIQKSLFLMVCGLVFVFSVQVVFYLIIKLWPRKKASGPDGA
ncbi:hypothetical protein [Breznakiella homolactica]|uniref:Uncharacterized protein n=1 Tax=Breznakiella homolactica TaxID=2798577 RepID=A0A7T7XMF7_9SPIR|nr:hypothetical protein [Breznakiella homolactica]QQO09044.1 hypothetical protein JFL75_19265 [Breznakiella homolactica]